MTKVIYIQHSIVYNKLQIKIMKGCYSYEEKCETYRMTRYDDHSIGGIEVETILLFNIEQIITEYEQKIFSSLSSRDYNLCEKHLTDFCMELLELTDREQVFIARTFFISLITDMIKVHSKKNQLHPSMLSYSYETIYVIEQYENLTEYLLFIPDFVKSVVNHILGDQMITVGNIHVEKALELIHYYLTKNCLSVKWIAKKLGISTTHLANVFKLEMGETITTYITNKKMNEIAFEIQHSNSPIKNIQKKYGFTNQSHFIQQFKKAKGLTPLQYKQKQFEKMESIT